MFKPKRILHPTDFSAHSKAAFELGCSIARDSGADLIVLHVVPPPVSYDEVAESRREGFRDRIRAELNAVRPIDQKQAVPHLLLDGDPATMILEAADAHRIDLIVLGTHGRTGVGRLLIGSVAEQVLRRAKCPVLTVKAPPIGVVVDQTAERWVTADT